jgi:peptidoglycan/LPS O-acetylase OafA/YrhL
VVIFFVLSGFLISRILFLNAEDLRNKSHTKNQKIFNFVVRRSLRIFPIYFLIIFLGIIFNIQPIRTIFQWFIFYLPNFYVIFHQHWIGVWDHFWSLAVEEQYYLFFPFIIFSISFDSYVKLLVGMICLGFISRLSFFLFLPGNFVEQNWFLNYVNPISVLDSFGFGGVLAYLHLYRKEVFDKIASNNFAIIFMMVLCLLNFFLDENSKFQHNNIFSTVFERSFITFFSFFLVAKVASESNFQVSKLLNLKPLVYLGQISYGLYAYHNFIYNYYHLEKNTLWWYLQRKIPIEYLELINFTPLLFILNFLLLVIVSSVSWHLIENPINRLKNKFE